MSDQPELRDAGAEERFRDRIFGVSGHEIAGLLRACMRREFYRNSSVGKNGKRIRKWVANLIGMEIIVIEVCTSSMGWHFDYHIETPEWDITVYLETLEHSFTGSDKPVYITKMKSDKVKISFPIFDGDSETFKSNMTIIKLMSLQDEDAAEDFMWPPIFPKRP